MKGVVFTEFLDMVEKRHGADLVDDIVEDCHLSSGGAYTAVGTYPHTEMVSLIQALAARNQCPVPALMVDFGSHLFGRFHAIYPTFFVNVHCALDFMEGIEDIIHAEVRKLYPDAELPKFEVEYRDEKQLRLVYDSHRHFEDLAEGLILGCIDHFGVPHHLQRENDASDPQGKTRFILTRL